MEERPCGFEILGCGGPIHIHSGTPPFTGSPCSITRTISALAKRFRW
jgi:hypothetical protein